MKLLLPCFVCCWFGVFTGIKEPGRCPNSIRILKVSLINFLRGIFDDKFLATQCFSFAFLQKQFSLTEFQAALLLFVVQRILKKKEE